MKRATKATVRIFIAIVSCGVAVGIALAVGVASGSTQGSQDPHPGATRAASSVIATVPAELSSSFALLTSETSAVMPTSLAANLGWAADDGVNPSLGREAGDVGSERLWLVPGSSESCIELDSGYSGCGSNALVEQQGVWVILKPVSGAAATMYGIVPDGASVLSDANSANVSQSGNAVVVTSSSSAMGQVTVHPASGPSVQLTVPPGTGQPQ